MNPFLWKIGCLAWAHNDWSFVTGYRRVWYRLWIIEIIK